MIALTGCASALESTTEITKPRVLGTVIRVQGDVGRATPAPGETIEVELVVADPGPRTGRSFVFVVCAPADTQFDVGACDSIVAGPFIGALPGPADPKPAPSFSFTIPNESELGDTTELRVLGGVCADGDLDLTFDPDAFQGGATTANPCADQTKEGRLVTFAIALERTPEDRNLIPTFETITLDGTSWSESAGLDEPTEGCAGGPLPQLAHSPFALPIDMTLTDGSREAFVNDRDPPEDDVEEPFVAFHATAGDYKGAYSFFDDTPNMPTLTWTMPSASIVPDTGLLVRHWFVLRDGRGGSSFVERAVCIVP